jgi:hypothetical protein
VYRDLFCLCQVAALSVLHSILFFNLLSSLHVQQGVLHIKPCLFMFIDDFDLTSFWCMCQAAHHCTGQQ